jgi:tRNA threonylcarbamoyladenosine biosynthesis protein TsaE
MCSPDMPEAARTLSLFLRSQRETQQLGRAFARALEPGDLVVLEGELGAGKTCLVRSIVRALGVPASQPVTSPTFEIMHEFAGRVPIIHADLYRLGAGEALDELGLVSHIGSAALVLVEWGERFADQLGPSGVRVTMSLAQGNARKVQIASRAASEAPLLARLFPQLSATGIKCS